jgi:hypothetical protein
MSNYRSSGGWGGKLFLAVLLALVAGYLWACFEKGRNPLDVLALFSSKEPEKTPEPAPKKEPPKPADPAPKKDPAPRPADPAPVVRPDPVAAPPAAKTYSSIEMSVLYGTLDDLLRKGRFFEASQKLKNTSKLMVPPDQASAFAGYEDRVRKYYDLLQETTMGVTVDMPRLTQIFIKGAGKLVVKVLSETTDAIYYETLTGIRSRIGKVQTETVKTLDPTFSSVEVSLELKKQADYKGVVVESEPGRPPTYREKPGRPVTGLQFFDLADFCARNGANDKLSGLFDEALKRDPDLLSTVHEVKGERMVNVFLYFLTINAASDANRTLDILKKSYSDTKSYRDKVATDTETKEAMDIVLNRPAPVAKVTPRSADPAPVPGVTPAPADPRPADPKPAVGSAPPASREPNAIALPEGVPARTRELVTKGDRHFDEAMRHLQNSDPGINPDGWADENKKALASFMAANNEGYFPAQEQFGAGAVPQALLDRVRETTMRSSLCRKRSVSTRK